MVNKNPNNFELLTEVVKFNPNGAPLHPLPLDINTPERTIIEAIENKPGQKFSINLKPKNQEPRGHYHIEPTSFDPAKAAEPPILTIPPKPELSTPKAPKRDHGGGKLPPVEEGGGGDWWGHGGGGNGGKVAFGLVALVALGALAYGIISYVDQENKKKQAKAKGLAKEQGNEQQPVTLSLGMAR